VGLERQIPDRFVQDPWTQFCRSAGGPDFFCEGEFNRFFSGHFFDSCLGFGHKHLLFFLAGAEIRKNNRPGWTLSERVEIDTTGL
jgi:hypothetical protein